MIKQTQFGWVDLSNLPKKRNSFDRDKCIGKTVDFQYEDIISTLTIVGRHNNQYMYIDIPGYVTKYPIYIGQIKNGQLGGAVKKITADFKYEIGDVVDGLQITNKHRKPGYKYYDYCCTIDQYSGTIREDHLVNGHGCPICHNSLGEKQVKEYLIENNINFIPQYTFDGCKNIRELLFDFYLPDFNACIEYDGQQHFEPVDFAGKGQDWAKQKFESTKLCDKIKNTYCQNNNISLCRIKYTQNVVMTIGLFFKKIKKKTQQND